MRNVKVSTQAEFDAALKEGNTAVCVSGSFRLVTTGTESPDVVLCATASLSVEAWESSQPRVVARGSSQPRVVAWGSSQPRVEAWGSSQPRVEARESSQPRVEARESSQPRVEAWGSSQPRVVAHGYVQISLKGRLVAKLARFVAALIHGNLPEVEGGQQTRVEINSAQDWCDYYGITVKDGVATLYKGVNAQFMSPRGGDYTPGRTPTANDWDDGHYECGGGLHFSPTPAMTREFAPNAERFVACPVALIDMRPPQETDGYPNKIKARGCCAPVWEVDEDGETLHATTET